MNRTSAFILLVLMMLVVGAMINCEAVAEDLNDSTYALDELEEEVSRILYKKNINIFFLLKFIRFYTPENCGKSF